PPPPTAIYSLSLHDALPICPQNTVQLVFLLCGEGHGREHHHFVEQGFPVFLNQETDFLRPYADELMFPQHYRNIVYRINQEGVIDRKSTRLNSSHVKISYAV